MHLHGLCVCAQSFKTDFLLPLILFRERSKIKMLKAVLKKTRDGGKGNKKESGKYIKILVSYKTFSLVKPNQQ